MIYRLADERDIESICDIVASAIAEMESRGIFQWDNVYPTSEDFISDIQEKNLFVGILDDRIAVMFAINKECDEQYANGAWRYPDSESRVIHRLCVDPSYQNRGVARETLGYIENILHDAGIETIRLDVFCDNPAALALYRNSGYEEVGTAQWRKGQFLLMEKHL